jgi:hypothetical protein
MIFALVLDESVELALAGAALGVLLLQGAFIAGRAGARSPAGTGHRRLAAGSRKSAKQRCRPGHSGSS